MFSPSCVLGRNYLSSVCHNDIVLFVLHSICTLFKVHVHAIGVFYDFWGTVKVAPHECVIRTGQP